MCSWHGHSGQASYTNTTKPLSGITQIAIDITATLASLLMADPGRAGGRDLQDGKHAMGRYAIWFPDPTKSCEYTPDIRLKEHGE